MTTKKKLRLKRLLKLFSYLTYGSIIVWIVFIMVVLNSNVQINIENPQRFTFMIFYIPIMFAMTCSFIRETIISSRKKYLKLIQEQRKLNVMWVARYYLNLALDFIDVGDLETASRIYHKIPDNTEEKTFLHYTIIYEGKYSNNPEIETLSEEKLRMLRLKFSQI